MLSQLELSAALHNGPINVLTPRANGILDFYAKVSHCAPLFSYMYKTSEITLNYPFGYEGLCYVQRYYIFTKTIILNFFFLQHNRSENGKLEVNELSDRKLLKDAHPSLRVRRDSNSIFREIDTPTCLGVFQ